jgi:hypothetical protein
VTVRPTLVGPTPAEARRQQLREQAKARVDELAKQAEAELDRRSTLGRQQLQTGDPFAADVRAVVELPAIEELMPRVVVGAVQGRMFTVGRLRDPNDAERGDCSSAAGRTLGQIEREEPT